MGAPDQHFEKLVQAEKQLQAAASEKKQLLIANKEAADKQLQAEKKLQETESEMKRLLIAKEEASDKQQLVE